MIDLISATLFQPTWRQCLASWDYPVTVMTNAETGQSLLQSYQTAFEESTAEVIGYVHDDLICHNPNWLQRVEEEFNDQSVGLVGFAGATRHGAGHLYTSPYLLSNLARGGFRSNMRDAEQHGARFEGSCNVAVLDGMALFIRHDVLLGAGGWPLETPISYFMYAEWLCCTARRLKWKIRLVGVAIDHLGGKSSGLNPNFKPEYEKEHEYIYNEFRDVLPAEVEP